MEYITEPRGGWDEWSDKYEQIQGLKLDTGEVINTRFIDNQFVDTNGNRIEVELPARKRIDEEITVERYEPDYSVSSLSLRQFANYLNQETKVVSYEELQQNHSLNY